MAANSNVEILQTYQSKVLEIIISASQMTRSIVILKYQPLKEVYQGILPKISRQTKSASKQARCQSYKSGKNNEKIQEKEIYGDLLS